VRESQIDVLREIIREHESVVSGERWKEIRAWVDKHPPPPRGSRWYRHVWYEVCSWFTYPPLGPMP